MNSSKKATYTKKNGWRQQPATTDSILTDDEAERTLLGMLIRGQLAFKFVQDYIPNYTVFATEAHQNLYRSIESLAADGKKVSAWEVKRVASQIFGPYAYEEPEKVEWASLITELKKLPDAKNVESTCIHIKETSMRRRFFDMSVEIEALSKSPSSDIYNALQRTEEGLNEIKTFSYAGEEFDFGKNLDSWLDRLDDIQQNGKVVGMGTGIKNLDAVTNGWYPGNLVTVGARPGMGKSAFMVASTRNVAVLEGQGVGIMSLEMTVLELTTRIMAIDTGYANGELTDGKNSVNAAYCREVAGKIRNANIILEANSYQLLEVERRLDRWATQGIKLVFIDYLQLIEDPEFNGTREQQVANITRRLKKRAQRNGQTIVIFSQLSREVDKRPNKVPQLSDLRESGAIEQDSDVVMFLYRPAYYSTPENPIDPGLEDYLEIHIPKNRNGRITVANPVKLQYQTWNNRIWGFMEPCPYRPEPIRDGYRRKEVVEQTTLSFPILPPSDEQPF